MGSSLSVFLSGSALSAVRLLSGLMRAKGIAAILGPSGIGLMAQATQFQLVATSASSFSITTAMIQGGRGEFSSRLEELFRGAILLIICGMAALTLLVLATGPAETSAWLFGPAHGAGDLLPLLASIPFLLASSSFLEASFFIHDRFDRYSIVSAIHAVAQSAVFVALTWAFGTKGLLLAFPLSAAALLALFALDLRRIGLLRWRWFVPSWNKKIVRFLLGHGSAMLLTGLGGGFFMLFVRSLLVARVGLAENGLLQVALAFSAYGGSVVTNFLWAKVHPACAVKLGRAEEDDISFALFTGFLVATVNWAAAPLSVPLVYSHQFVEAIPLMGTQAVGDVFYFSFFTLSVAGLARGGVRTYVIAWSIYFLPYLWPALFPSMLSAKSMVGVHLGASILAFSAQGVLNAVAGLVSWNRIARAAAFTVPLGCLLGAGVVVTGDSILYRAAGAGLIILGGFGLWKLTYGPIALATAKIFLSRIRGFWASTPRSHQ